MKILELGLIVALVVLAVLFFHNAAVDDQYVRTHPVVQTHAVYKTKVVYRRADDVNAMFVKAHRFCLGDGGVGAILLFPLQPKNWEALCAFGHSAFTDSGMKL